MKRVVAAGVLALGLLAGPSLAQAPAAPAAPAAPLKPGMSVTYNVRAKGITAGTFTYTVRRAGGTYSAVADRKMTGLVRAVVGSKQDYHYTAKGWVTAEGVRALAYQHNGGKKNRVVNVAFTDDDIVTIANPPMGMGNPPATKEQKKGALDQLSSIYAMAILDGDPCTKTARIYLDGRTRFDLVMSPNGTEKVSSSAFKGVAKRCSVQFKPIAGFSDPQPPATLTFLFGQVGGIYAPLRIAMPTDDAGIVILEAKSFQTIAATPQ